MLNKKLRKFFWDYNFKSLSLKHDGDLIIRRILEVGDWESIRWLRKKVGDSRIRLLLKKYRGRGMDRRRLNYWCVKLNINRKELDSGIKQNGRSIWENRTG